MSKDEITNLKEEFYKEIRKMEKNLNLELTVKLKELDEKNDKFIQDFEQLSKNNKTLTDLISKQNLDSHKIKEYDIFKRKADTMILSHDIRINTAIKDINEIKFTFGREISENLSFPGFIGPLCKYKNLSQYLQSNVNEIEKIKSDCEFFKKENKEIKKKIEDILKTCLNLVDKSSEKNIQYFNNKIQNLEDIINNKLADTSENIFKFKALLLTHDTINEFRKKIFDEINDINYNKEEVDKLINNVLDNTENNLNDIKNVFMYDMNNSFKNKTDKIENDIKEINKYIRDIQIKIFKFNQIQNKYFKELTSLKNANNKNSGNISKRKDSDDDNIFCNNFKIDNTLFTPLRSIKGTKTKTTRINKLEEEKIGRGKFFHTLEKNKNIDSIKHTKTKSSKKLYIKDSYKDKKNYNEPITKSVKTFEFNSLNKINDNFYKDNKKEKNLIFNNKKNIKLNLFNNESSSSSYNNINDDMNKEKIDSNNASDKEEKKKDITSPEKKVKFRINNRSSNKTKYKTSIMKNQKKEKENIKEQISPKPQQNLIIKKEESNELKDNKKIDLSNIISFGLSNKEKLTFIPLEQNTNDDNNNINNKNNEKLDAIINILEKTNSPLNLKTINNKTKTNNNAITTLKKETKKIDSIFSLYKIASIEANAKLDDNFNFNHTISKLSKRTNNLVKPLRKEYSPLHLSYDSKLNNNERNNNNFFNDKKITSAFGRTSYSIYNKKEEGIQNLINKKIINNKKYRNEEGNFNVELSPVAKIKIFEN